MSVLDNLQRIAKAMPERFKFYADTDGWAHLTDWEWDPELRLFNHSPYLGPGKYSYDEFELQFLFRHMDEFGLYDFSAYSGPLVERMLAALADKVEGMK